MGKIKSVDDYIAGAPNEVQSKLREMRRAIKSVTPKAVEKISYNMPYYGYKGRLAYFAYARKHIGIYLPTPTIQEHTRELKKYETAKATVRFPLDQKLPVTLIKKLVRARMKMNDRRLQRKK